jgi:hypothetical protein
VRWGSSILNAALWFRRSALQFTTCPALEVDYCCICLLGVQHWEFISLPHPLSLGQAVLHPPSLLSVFQFCGAVWFWMLLSGSRDQLCGPLPSPLLGVAYCQPTLSIHCFSCVCLLMLGTELTTCSSPFLWFVCCQLTVCYSVLLRGSVWIGEF